MPNLRLNPVAGPGQPTVISLRCPSCHHLGAFHGAPSTTDLLVNVRFQDAAGRQGAMARHLGLRVCPNPSCQEIIFLSFDKNNDPITYPAQRIDFDSQHIPSKILSSFEEAITAHANRCYRSAALMVRRTLEEVCAEREANGDSLKARIASLGSLIIVPKELLEAADELRLLGNDAAHLEARVYDEIGKEEVEAAVLLCKEILKAVYQLSSLVERLRKLKK